MQMKIQNILSEIQQPEKYKVHLAIGANDKYDPLNAFWSGNFKDWQERQNQKNFEREFILSLIYFNASEWLFAGIFERLNVRKMKNYFKYKT